MLRKTFIFILGLCLLVGSAWLILQLEKQYKTLPDPIYQLPQSTQFIIHYRPGHSVEFARQCADLSDLLDENFDSIKNLIGKLDSLRQSNEAIQQILLNRPATLSVHKTNNSEYVWALCLSMPVESSREIAEDVLKEKARAASVADIPEYSWEDTPIYLTGDRHVSRFTSSLALGHSMMKAIKQQNILENDSLFISVASARHLSGLQLFLKNESDGSWQSIAVESNEQAILLHGITFDAQQVDNTPTFTVYTKLIPSGASFTASTVRKNAQLNAAISDVEQACNCDVTRFFLDKIVSVVSIQNKEGGYFLIHYPGLLNNLDDFSTLTGPDVEQEFGYPIFKFNHPQLFENMGAKAQLSFITYAYDHIIATKSRSELVAYIELLIEKETLDENSRWKLSDALIPKPICFERSERQHFFPFRELDFIAAGYPALHGHHYQLMVIPREMDVTSEDEKEDEAVGGLSKKWLTPAPELSNGPWLTLNHYTHEGEILWQDKNDFIHLVSSTGNELWKARIDGQVQGEINQVDALKNGKLQLLFSTKTSIYCLDRNGKLLSGFPISLPAKATSSVAVLDYDSNKKYRLLIGCEGGRLLNFTIEGKSTRGWKFGRATSDIKHVEHLRIRNKDYIFALEQNGSIHLLKRNGLSRFDSKAKAMHHASKDFHFIKEKSIGSTQLIYPDTLGNIVVLQFNQALSEFGLTGFSSGTRLLMADINQDNKDDYIVSDKKNLRVYDSNFSRILKWPLQHAILSELKVFEFSKSDLRIGFITSEGQVLLNLKGGVTEGFPQEIDKGFIIYDLDRDGKLEVVGFLDGALKCKVLD